MPNDLSKLIRVNEIRDINRNMVTLRRQCFSTTLGHHHSCNHRYRKDHNTNTLECRGLSGTNPNSNPIKAIEGLGDLHFVGLIPLIRFVRPGRSAPVSLSFIPIETTARNLLLSVLRVGSCRTSWSSGTLTGRQGF